MILVPVGDRYELADNGCIVLSLPASLFAGREAAEQVYAAFEAALDQREQGYEELLAAVEEDAGSRIDPSDLPDRVDIRVQARLSLDSPGVLVVCDPVTQALIAEIRPGCSSRKMLECMKKIVEWALERAFREYCNVLLDAPDTSFGYEE
jgi:hypothetical protein